MLRLQNIFAPQQGGMIGNDLPSQGGIMGRPDIFQPSSPDIFGGGRAIPESPMMGPPESMAGNMPVQRNRIEEIYSPETVMQEKMAQMIDQMPERNKPGFGRKLLASIVGMGGGPQTADKVLYGKYDRDLADWKNRFDPIRQAAIEERQGNVGERQYARDVMTNEAQNRRLDITEQNNLARQKVAEDRAKIYDFKVRNPNWRIVAVKGGNYVAIDPQNPANKADTGVPTGTLSDAEAQALRVEGQEHLANVRGDIQSRHIEERGDVQEELVGVREKSQGRLIEKREQNLRGRPAKSTSAAGSPTQERTRIRNNAEKFMRDNPSLAKWIDTSGTSVKITPPSSGGFFSRGGPTQEEYNRIKAGVESGSSAPSNIGRAANIGTDERVRVTAPNGKTGSVPRARLAELKKKGYKEIK